VGFVPLSKFVDDQQRAAAQLLLETEDSPLKHDA
jgi:hypothetical protein